MTLLGLVVTDPSVYALSGPDLDTPHLLAALAEQGLDARAVAWRDGDVDWSAFDLLVLRSPWDYQLHVAEFAAWLDRVGAVTRVVNPPELVRWNLDKRYLAELERAGVPVVPTRYVGEDSWLGEAIDAVAQEQAAEHVVLKPAVSAGSQRTGLFAPDDPSAVQLGREILADGGTVMVQPEIPELSAGAEKALYLIDERFTHAMSKGALLARGGGLRGGTYQEDPQTASASAAEQEFATSVLDAACAVTGAPTPLYARIDLVDSQQHGLVLLEAELIEPALNLDLAPEAAGVMAAGIGAAVAR